MNTIALPQSLLKRLEKFSENTHMPPSAIVKQAVINQLDHDEWLLKQVDAGLADVAAGRVHTSESVKKMLGVTNAKKR